MKTALHHLQSVHVSEYSNFAGLKIMNEEEARHSGASLLCLASISLMALFFAFYFIEGDYNLLPALVLASILPIAALFRLGYKGNAPTLLFLCGLNFIALSSFMFIYDSSPSSPALFWFMFVPPLLVFSMSRRAALWLFLVFFLALGRLFFLTPLHQKLGEELSMGFRARFMATTALAAVFLLIVEYVRDRNHRSLMHVLRRLYLFASTDPLTGIGNRRDFQNHLKWLQAQSERSGEPFGIALLEVDHFQDFCDAYGGRVSEILLRHAAKTVNDALRETDRVFRWSNQQFALLIPGVDLPSARIVVERVRRHVERARLFLPDGGVIPVTVSVGLDAWSRVSTLEEVMSNADQRLYLAKKLGRNRVYTGAVNQAVRWFPGLKALPRAAKSPACALASFPMPVALPARV